MVSRRGALLGLLAIPAAPLLHGGAARAADAGPTAPISALLDGLRANMAAGSATPFQKRYDTLAPVIDQAINMQQILQTSVGLHWRDLPAEKQTQLVEVFRRYTIAQYVANFDSTGNKLVLLPDRRTAGADQIVETQLVNPAGDATRIDYVMRQNDGSWKAVDVLLEGSISRVAVQRSDFRTLVGSGDGSALIASLQKKITDLSGGALQAG